MGVYQSVNVANSDGIRKNLEGKNLEGKFIDLLLFIIALRVEVEVFYTSDRNGRTIKKKKQAKLKLAYRFSAHCPDSELF